MVERYIFLDLSRLHFYPIIWLPFEEILPMLPNYFYLSRWTSDVQKAIEEIWYDILDITASPFHCKPLSSDAI